MKYKVFLLPPGENWICDRFTDEWYKYNSDISTKNPYEADVIWLIADWCFNQLPYDLLRKKKVITTNFHIVPEKFNNISRVHFEHRDLVTDLYNASCNKTAEYLRKIGTKKPIKTELFWVNQNIWFDITKEKARKILGLEINDDENLIGSFQRDTEGNSIGEGKEPKPKIEKGPELFCDLMEYIRDNSKVKPVVLLGGWRRQYVIRRLEQAKIKYIYKELPSFETLNLMYNSLDCYFVTSKYEGGPQALLECGATKTPVISTDVGVASHILPPFSISKERTPKSLYDCSVETGYVFNKVKKLFIPDGFKPFRKIIEDLCERKTGL